MVTCQSLTAVAPSEVQGTQPPQGIGVLNLCAPVRRLPGSLVPARRVPTEIPQVRVQDGVPHKIPTDDTALSGTCRHEC
jgi:hypothetical protein